MVVVPAVTPVTTPEVPIVATAVLLLAQVPPLTVLVREVVRPVHTLAEPEMVPADGAALTVTTVLRKQPLDNE